MSKLDELINKSCSKGVLYVRLCDAFDEIKGMGGVSNKWKEDGNCQFIDYLNVYNHLAVDVNDLPFATVKSLDQDTLKRGDILFTSASETPDECALEAAIECDIKEGVFLDDHLFGLRPNRDYKNKFLTGFLKHYFRSDGFRKKVAKTVRGVTRFYLSKPAFMNIEIPVPPMEVQCEIVRILDNFTELTVELTVELTAELTARKKQYEYYRDCVFDSIDKTFLHSVEEVFETRNGFTPSKAESSYWENGTLPWFRLEDINLNGRILNDSIQHITQFALKKSGLFSANSIIVTTSATIGEYALIKVPFLCNQRFTCLTIRPKFKNALIPEYFLHYCYKLSEYCKNNLNKGNFASVDMGRFYAFKFPIPTLEKQKEIIELLDNFDVYCKSLQDGLPAEINARQKQYEYYRDKLLTFKELKVEWHNILLFLNQTKKQ